MYKRRLIREKALQALYAYELSKEPITDVIANVFGELKSQKDDFEFAKKLVAEVIHHEAEVEKYIRAKVAHWEFDRIAIVDRLLLRMGICEMLYFPDIPPKVTINELIEIAKTFSTEKSGKFINGVLDAILEELTSADSIKKTGRGLINESPHPEQPHLPSSRKPAKGK
ncbi:MAG TPA: transcription antitermination factor NusB [Bacteroidota bacterium]|nr:transcription antitermination factor NusB [Bacteroidota bacterium]